MLEEIKNINTNKKDIKKFGITFGIIFFMIGIFLFFNEKEFYQIFLYLAIPFISLGLIIPIILRPFYILWMTFALFLGCVMTKVTLSLIFYFIITPIGILSRFFGKDFLSLNKKSKDSYWEYRDKNIEMNQDYEKQF